MKDGFEKWKLNTKKVKEILAKHDIKMSVVACGCCGSPRVRFEYKGNTIVEDGYEFDFSMFEE